MATHFMKFLKSGQIGIFSNDLNLIWWCISALRFYRQTLDVVADIEEMETEMQDVNESNPNEEESYTMKKLFKTKALHIPLMVACMLQVIQQFSGINAVRYYCICLVLLSLKFTNCICYVLMVLLIILCSVCIITK